MTEVHKGSEILVEMFKESEGKWLKHEEKLKRIKTLISNHPDCLPCPKSCSERSVK